MRTASVLYLIYAIIKLFYVSNLKVKLTSASPPKNRSTSIITTAIEKV